MMKHRIIALCALAVSVFSTTASAESTPVGTWRAIDDVSHQVKALIRIEQLPNGELAGQIVKLLQHPDAVCDQCEGERKGKPDLGMTILWGLRPDGDAWSGGHILDPQSGEIYRAELKLLGDGGRMEVRGFVGFSLLGRSQIWLRE